MIDKDKTRAILQELALDVAERCAKAEGYESFADAFWGVGLKEAVEKALARLERQALDDARLAFGAFQRHLSGEQEAGG